MFLRNSLGWKEIELSNYFCTQLKVHLSESYIEMVWIRIWGCLNRAQLPYLCLNRTPQTNELLALCKNNLIIQFYFSPGYSGWADEKFPLLLLGGHILLDRRRLTMPCKTLMKSLWFSLIWHLVCKGITCEKVRIMQALPNTIPKWSVTRSFVQTQWQAYT
jgi:hypothetical protein